MSAKLKRELSRMHRRVQAAESSNARLHSKGRATLAIDCIREQAHRLQLEETLGQIRAVAAGWSKQPYPMPESQRDALIEIEKLANAGLTCTPFGDVDDCC